jgi:acetyl-CoA acetyltransferase
MARSLYRRCPAQPHRQAQGWPVPRPCADLGAHVLKALVERNAIPAEDYDDVIFGCVDTIGAQAGDIARTAWLAAGLPLNVPGTTVDRQCGSRSRPCTSPPRR